MIKFSKMKLGLLCLGAFVFCNSSLALAADTVTETKDNITVTKKAEWTTVDGKKADDSGNPYAKITFKVDATNAADQVVNVVTKAGDADIVIVLDNSGSMGTEFDAAKDAAAEFAEKMISIDNYNVRVGLVTMGSTGIRAVELTSDKNRITSAIRNLEFDPVMWGTNFQEALYETQNMLATSTAPNKLVVFQSDGVPEQCYKTNNCTNKTGTDVALGANDSECAINQTNILKRLYPNVKIATIGYTHATSNHDVLKQMASRDDLGNMMFFEATARAQVTAYLGNLSNAFRCTESTFNNIITGNTLVDKVPAEYSVVASSLKSSDSKVEGKINGENNLVTFTWKEKLEKKTYELSFIIKLKKNKVPAEYISENREVYTNGTTIDVTKDSSNSAIFNYGTSSKIALKSPTLKLDSSLFEVITVPEVAVPEADAPTSNLDGSVGDEKEDKKATDSTPATGDETNLTVLFIILGVAVVSMTAIGIVMKKKRMM